MRSSERLCWQCNESRSSQVQGNDHHSELDTEQKVLAIQKEVEEATALELPMLEKNLVFLSTIASVATLMGLLGTVIGMIRSFAALGDSGGGEAASETVPGYF